MVFDLSAARPVRTAHRRWPSHAPAFARGAASDKQRWQQYAEREIERAREALNELEKQLQSDPGYARKRAILLPTMQVLLPKLPPAQWVDVFMSAYRVADPMAVAYRVALANEERMADSAPTIPPPPGFKIDTQDVHTSARSDEVGAKERPGHPPALYPSYILDQEIRAKLAALWQRIGFSANEAHEMAAAYEQRSEENSLIAQVRSNGAASAIPAIRHALGEHDALLAGQLFVAYLLAADDEHRAAGTPRTILQLQEDLALDVTQAFSLNAASKGRYVSDTHDDASSLLADSAPGSIRRSNG